MPTTAWKFAGTGASYNDGGATAWSNPGNITASDDTRANSNMAASGTSQCLRASNFGFTTSDIPSGATPTGIEVRIERSAGNTGPRDRIIQLAKISAGTSADRVGSNKAATTTDWPGAGADAQASYGGAADLWSASFTSAEIRSSNFAVDIAATNNSGAGFRNALVDAVEVRITYTVPVQQGSATLVARSSLTAAGRLRAKGSASLVGRATLSARGFRALPGALAMVGRATVSAAGKLIARGSSSMAGRGSLAAGGRLIARGSAALHASGIMAGRGVAIMRGTASLIARGALAAGGRRALFGAASMVARGTLAATGRLVARGSAALVGRGLLAALGIKRLLPPTPRRLRVTGSRVSGRTMRVRGSRLSGRTLRVRG